MRAVLSRRDGVNVRRHDTERSNLSMPAQCSIAGCTRPSRSRTWCKMHYRRWQRRGDASVPILTTAHLSVAERFWLKVKKTETCWLWTGALDKHGYGVFRYDGLAKRAHRVAYILLVGPLDNALSIDHLCRVHNCVRPAHLEAVPIGVNVLRGETVSARNKAVTRCPMGHAYDEANTYIDRGGRRSCRACRPRWVRRDPEKERLRWAQRKAANPNINREDYQRRKARGYYDKR